MEMSRTETTMTSVSVNMQIFKPVHKRILDFINGEVMKKLRQSEFKKTLTQGLLTDKEQVST